jgi:fatty acid desaturase
MKKERENPRQNCRIPKGYQFETFEKPLLRALCRTSPTMSIIIAVSDWVWIAACGYAGMVLMAKYGWVLVGLLHLLLLWPLCARGQRGLENLTHEASHFNFYRDSKKLNDAFADWLCAYWVLISVEMFREPHLRHHRYFGAEADPDKTRFSRLNLDKMPRQSPRKLALYLPDVLPTYIRDYWKQFSDKKGQLLRSLITHAALVTLTSCTLYENFWMLWLIYFWVPFVFFLPVHRFFAEAEEHRYLNAKSEFGSTFSNVGWFQRWFLHPHGDAFHLLHHMLPQVPHWKMAYGHRILSVLDSNYDGGLYRKSIFDNPKSICVPLREGFR